MAQVRPHVAGNTGEVSDVGSPAPTRVPPQQYFAEVVLIHGVSMVGYRAPHPRDSGPPRENAPPSRIREADVQCSLGARLAAASPEPLLMRREIRRAPRCSGVRETRQYSLIRARATWASGDRLFGTLGHLLENAVEIGGHQPQRTFTIARRLQ